MNKNDQYLKLENEIQEFATYLKNSGRYKGTNSTDNNRYDQISAQGDLRMIAYLIESLPPERREKALSYFDLGRYDFEKVNEYARKISLNDKKLIEEGEKFWGKEIKSFEDFIEFVEKESKSIFEPIYSNVEAGKIFNIDAERYRKIISGEKGDNLAEEIIKQHPEWDTKQIATEFMRMEDLERAQDRKETEKAALFEKMGGSHQFSDNDLQKFIEYIQKNDFIYGESKSDVDQAFLAMGMSEEAQEQFLEKNSDMIAPAKAMVRSSMLLKVRDREIKEKLEGLCKEFGISALGLQSISQNLSSYGYKTVSPTEKGEGR